MCAASALAEETACSFGTCELLVRGHLLLCSIQAVVRRRPVWHQLGELEALLADIEQGATPREWANAAAATLEAMVRSAANHEVMADTDAVGVLAGLARMAAADAHSGMSAVALHGSETLTTVARALRCARAWAPTELTVCAEARTLPACACMTSGQVAPTGTPQPKHPELHAHMESSALADCRSS